MGQGSLESHVESQLWARGRMDLEPSVKTQDLSVQTEQAEGCQGRTMLG